MEVRIKEEPMWDKYDDPEDTDDSDSYNDSEDRRYWEDPSDMDEGDEQEDDDEDEARVKVHYPYVQKPVEEAEGNVNIQLLPEDLSVTREEEEKKEEEEVNEYDVAFMCESVITKEEHTILEIPSENEEDMRVLESSLRQSQMYERSNRSTLVPGLQLNVEGGRELFRCNKCSCAFSLTDEFTSHNCAMKPQSFKCQICDQHFVCNSSLVRHVQTAHSGKLLENKQLAKGVQKHSEKGFIVNDVNSAAFSEGRPYTCKTCGKSFKTVGDVNVHLRIHTGERPYACTMCNKSFSRKSHLSEHLRTHTGEKPFECPVCKKTFSNKSNVLTHVRIHTGEKPFECTLCDRSFPQKSGLLYHLRTHSTEKPFECTICKKKFAHQQLLVTHVRVHTGEKPYKCMECFKSFSHRGTLWEHRRIHASEKSFECAMCAKSFYQRRRLIKHLHSHNGQTTA